MIKRKCSILSGMGPMILRVFCSEDEMPVHVFGLALIELMPGIGSLDVFVTWLALMVSYNPDAIFE